MVALMLFGATASWETIVILQFMVSYEFRGVNRQSVAVMNRVQQYGPKLFGKYGTWSKGSSNCLLHKPRTWECNMRTCFCHKAIFHYLGLPPRIRNLTSQISGYKINKAAGIFETRSFKHLDGKKRWVMLGSRWWRRWARRMVFSCNTGELFKSTNEFTDCSWPVVVLKRCRRML